MPMRYKATSNTLTAANVCFDVTSGVASDSPDDVPLVFQFSGTVFFSCADGNMQIAQIGWDKESRFRLPAGVWREMMDLYYPNSSWLRLRRDIFDRLLAYKQQQGLATWEQALDNLLPGETRMGPA